MLVGYQHRGPLPTTSGVMSDTKPVRKRQRSDTEDYQDDASPSSAHSQKNDQVLYCICRSADGGGFMVQCDFCEEWYHGECVNFSPSDSKRCPKYKCPPCKNKEVTSHKRCAKQSCPNRVKGKGPFCTKCSQEPSSEKRPSSSPAPVAAASHAPRQHSVAKERTSSPDGEDEINDSIIQEIMAHPTSPDRDDMRSLQQLKNTFKDAQRVYEIMKADKNKLKDQIEHAQRTVVENFTQADEVDSKVQLDCEICGRQVQAAIYAKHVEKCFARDMMTVGAASRANPNGNSEERCPHLCAKTKQPCPFDKLSCILHSDRKKLKNRRCGCPLEGGSVCELRQADCMKHRGWESNRMSALQVSLLNQRTRLDEVMKQQHRLLRKMQQRYLNNRRDRENTTVEEPSDD